MAESSLSMPLLRHRVAGNANSARTIMFVNGFGCGQAVWDAVIPPFERDYRIILFDHTGSNYFVDEVYTEQRYGRVQGFLDDLLGLCQRLGVRDATLVGHSFGGLLAMVAANRGRSHFGRLVLLCASARYLDAPEEGYVGGFSRGDLAVIYDEMNRQYFAWVSGFGHRAMANADRPEMGERFVAQLQALRPDVAQVVFRAFAEYDARGELPRIEQPTLVLQSRHDLAVPPPTAVYLAQQIPHSQLVFLDADGHLPHVSHPDQVRSALLAFLQQDPPASG